MLQIQNISPILVNVGGTVRIYGAGFDSLCSVRVGGLNLAVLDYDDGWLDFAAPSGIGVYSVSVLRDGTVVGAFRLTVVELKESETWNVPERKNVVRNGVDCENEEFRNALLGLMPRGFAWFCGRNGNWWKLFSAFSLGFSFAYALFRSLVDESSPAKTSSFETWEKELGLPINGIDRETADGRRSEIFRVARKQGGCTIPYFKSIAALFGKDVSVYEYWKNPEKFEDVDFGEDDPNFYWMLEVEADPDDWYECTCNDTCNDYLQRWWNGPIESMFDAIKPAHTKLLYVYVEVEREFVLADNDDNVIVTPKRVPVAAAVLSAEIVNPGTTVLPDGTTARTVRIKDLPDAGEENGYLVLDSEEGGTKKTRGYTDEEIDDLWNSTPAEGDDDDV